MSGRSEKEKESKRGGKKGEGF